MGQYLVLAAVNRAVAPRSKRSFYEDWYKGGVVSRLCPAKASELTSQLLDLEVTTEDGRVQELEWSWNLERKSEVQRRHLGKQTRMTSRHDWDSVSIVRAYRRLTRMAPTDDPRGNPLPGAGARGPYAICFQ